MSVMRQENREDILSLFLQEKKKGETGSAGLVSASLNDVS